MILIIFLAFYTLGLVAIFITIVVLMTKDPSTSFLNVFSYIYIVFIVYIFIYLILSYKIHARLTTDFANFY